MKYETLKNTIATLEKLRDVHNSQLDASALTELDDVLLQLRSLLISSGKQRIEHSELAFRVLRIIDVIIRTVSNLTDWMK